jgi:transposase
MSVDPANLPTDLAAAHEMILALVETLAEREKSFAALHHRLHVLERAMFGHRSERVVEGQQQIPFEPSAVPPPMAPPPSPPESAAQATSSDAAPRRKGAHGRRKMPENLPQVHETIDVAEGEKLCKHCGKPKVLIGEDVRWRLDALPARIYVLIQHLLKYGCGPCEGDIVVATKPPEAIEGGLPAEGLLAEIVVSKFDDHIPLYRIEEILARHGIEIPRSDQCDWLRASAELLFPITAAMRRELLLSDIVRFDETTVPVQDPLGGPTRTGRLWAFLGDAEHPLVVFNYTRDRSSEGLRAFLEGYNGRYAQADAYKGHDFLFNETKILEVGCNAHARRKAYEARSTDTLTAHTVIALYRRLYAVESEARGRSPDERKRIRDEKARPVWDAFKTWIDGALPSLLPKSPMGDAIGYIHGQWCALTRYLEDGRLEIDNNDTERALRSVAIGRKNWLFAGSDKAAERHAIFYTLIETCHRHDVNTWLYIKDVLKSVSTHPAKEIAELFPHRWKLRHPDAHQPPLDGR